MSEETLKEERTEEPAAAEEAAVPEEPDTATSSAETAEEASENAGAAEDKQEASKDDGKKDKRRFRKPSKEEEKIEALEKEQAALTLLKNTITQMKGNVRSSDDGGKYIYFYVPYDKLDAVESAFSDLDMGVYRHVSHLGGQEVTVLRYPATMIPGEDLQIIEQLREAIKSRRDNRADFEHGNTKVNQKEALDELKKMINSIKLAQYPGELEPSHRYFYFNRGDIDRAYDLMHEKLGIKVEKYKSNSQLNGRSGETFVLRLPIKDENARIRGIITDLQLAIATRGISRRNDMGGRVKI